MGKRKLPACSRTASGKHNFNKKMRKKIPSFWKWENTGSSNDRKIFLDECVVELPVCSYCGLINDL